MKKVLFVVASAAMVVGCAATPESIAPAYVSDVTYESWSCRQLGEEAARLNAAYTTAADQQHKARDNDTVGILLLGLPVSSLSGQNVAAQVASIKGNQIAVQHAATLKDCSAQTSAKN